jgi:hypothetical protein
VNRRVVLVFLVVFAALVILVVLQNRQLSQQPAPGETPFIVARALPDIDSADEIQAIRLQDPSSEAVFVLNRTEIGWEAPETEGELNQAAAEAIATTVALLPVQRLLPPEEDLSVYGLSEAGSTLFIQVVLTDGSGHAVAVGALSAAGTTYYALVDENEAVFILERGAVDFLQVALRNPPVS